MINKPNQKLKTDNNKPIESSKDKSTITQDHTRFTQSGTKTQDSSDLLLDITHLSMNQIKMNLEDLDAEVTVRVELTDQIHIDVVTNVQFDKVNIDMKNVEIQAQVKVNLKKISEIIDSVLKTIEDNPELLNIPINKENVLSVNLSMHQKGIKETLDTRSEKVIEGESHVKKD